MTSNRQRKKRLAQDGLTDAEFKVVELLEEILERFRWLQILGYTCNFLLREKLKISEEERDRILKASASAVEKDGTLKEWQDRVAQIIQDLKHSRSDIRREVKRAKKSGAQESGSEAS